MFDGLDKVHLSNLMKLIRDNLELNKLDCVRVSHAFRAFEWLEKLDEKIDGAIGTQRENEDLKEALKTENEGLIQHIKELEAEIEELKKPKRRPRRKAK